MNFTDNSIQPNFSADVQKLSGTITGLSSAFDARAKVDLKGELDEFSPVTIAGELQPFAFDRHSDLAMRFENIALPIFNPYSGSLAGYNIAKGKLTTDLHYVIENRQLDAQHKIRIDQLEWGEATRHQGEATLPVKFATSLLKDRNGVINLDVPVTGTLDDPTFRIGPIIWQIIKNLITKAVTAPFALLGGLFAGAEEAQFVDFAPGDATLDAATSERLAALGKSLVEKPELKLDVPIGVLADLDGPALTERAYRDALAGAAAGRAGKDEAAPAYDALTPEQKVAALTAHLRQQTGAAPVVPEPAEPPDGTLAQGREGAARGSRGRVPRKGGPRQRHRAGRRARQAGRGARRRRRTRAAHRHGARADARVQGARGQAQRERGQGAVRTGPEVAAAYPAATGAVTAELRKPCPPDCWQ